MELGTAGMHNQVRQWAEQGFMVDLLNLLNKQGFSVFLTSDHGNIEAKGCGRPSEGSVAELRGERVRIYSDALLRKQGKDRFPDTIDWPSIGLPDNYLPLLAPGRSAFVNEGETVIAHGGLHDGIVKSLKGRNFRSPVEWAIFAMIANRALAPDSKRAVVEWVRDERIKAHVLLCFLALVLVRILEQQIGLTWDKIRSVMERMHLGEFESKDGRIFQRTELTPEQANILKRLGFSPPPWIHKI